MAERRIDAVGRGPCKSPVPAADDGRSNADKPLRPRGDTKNDEIIQGSAAMFTIFKTSNFNFHSSHLNPTLSKLQDGGTIQNQSMQHTFFLAFPSQSLIPFLPQDRIHQSCACLPHTHHLVFPSNCEACLGGGVLPINPHSIIFCCRHKPPRHLGVDFYARSLFLPYLGVRTNLSFPPVRPYKLLAGWLCLTCNAHCTLHCTSFPSFLFVRDNLPPHPTK